MQWHRINVVKATRNGLISALIIAAGAAPVLAQTADVPAAGTPPVTNAIAVPEAADQRWNWHVQNTDIVDGHPAYPAKYSGPNSLRNHSELQETVSLDLLLGARLWRGAEAHVDGLMWQGFGFSKTLGLEAFPNAEAYRVGTMVPNVVFSRLFIRQTIGLGGEEESIEDDQLHLASKVDASRLTFTVGKMSAKDVFDNNAYANDQRSQFLSWGLVANEAWDYPADSLGFTTGATIELNQPGWAVRYGFFQVPRLSNGLAQDQAYFRAWAMVTELERRWTIHDHPGAVRLLAYLNRAHMGSYQAVLDNPGLGGNIAATRAYRYKYGFGLNAEQELVKGVGAFLRVGWSDGRNEAWMYSDIDHAVSTGLSINGKFWNRTNDTVGVAGILSGISHVHRDFLAAGGVGILAGDGTLNYALEQSIETYYDCQIWKTVHLAFDYQFINHPAFNRDRGPVSVLGGRLHWEF